MYLFCWLFADKLLVLLFKCKFSEWPADFSCIMGDLHEKRWRFYFFFLWLTPAEEGSQARSHKITLTEFIRLTLEDKHSTFIHYTLFKTKLEIKEYSNNRLSTSWKNSIHQVFINKSKNVFFFLLFAFLLFCSDFNLWIVSYKSL